MEFGFGFSWYSIDYIFMIVTQSSEIVVYMSAKLRAGIVIIIMIIIIIIIIMIIIAMIIIFIQGRSHSKWFSVRPCGEYYDLCSKNVISYTE